MESSQRNNKGRPNNGSMNVVIQQQRDEQPQEVKQYWTEHRITLIAYQVQYVRDTKPQDTQQNKHKIYRKKNNLEYETGFLLGHIESSKPIDIHKRIRQFDQLESIRNSTHEDELELYQFVKIMLDLKHQTIVLEFMHLYNSIVREIKLLKFQDIREEHTRELWLKETTHKIINYLRNQKDYPFLNMHLTKYTIDAQRLIKVEIYCLMAQKFNFNINQYYSEAFNVTLLAKANKKIKAEQHANYEEL